MVFSLIYHGIYTTTGPIILYNSFAFQGNEKHHLLPHKCIVLFKIEVVLKSGWGYIVYMILAKDTQKNLNIIYNDSENVKFL